MSIAEKIYDLEQRFNALFSGFRLVSDDTWADTGSLQNGWGKGAGFFKYRKLVPGVVFITARGLTCSGATNATGTVILSAANGLTGPYTPITSRTLPAYCDVQRIQTGFTGNDESAALKFMPDGSVQCMGVANAATVLDCSGIFDINI